MAQPNPGICAVQTPVSGDDIRELMQKALMSDARHPEVRAFSLFICLDAAKFVLLSVFTLTLLV